MAKRWHLYLSRPKGLAAMALALLSPTWVLLQQGLMERHSKSESIMKKILKKRLSCMDIK